MNKQTFISLFFIFCCPFALASPIEAIRENNKGVKALEKDNKPMAEEKLLSALAEDPFNPVVRLNLGVTYETEEYFDKALKEYQTALRLPQITDDLKFKAHFNSGNVLANQKKIDEALAHYQAALELNPQSEETKINIELLLKGGAGQGKGKKDKGDGKGDGKDPSDQKDKQGSEPKPNDPQDDNGKDKKKEFKSQNLSKEDVRKILEELKSQEQKVRALEYGSKGKEAAPGKDW